MNFDLLAAAASPADPSWTDKASAIAAVVAAVAAVLTFVVAVVAARYAGRQVREARAQLDEARTQRREQAQPYVVVYAEVMRSSPHFVDVVVKNFGSTGAHDLRITCLPKLQRSGEDAYRDLDLPALPFLAPGQEWRTFWDSAIERGEANLPNRYELVASYKDSEGNMLATPSVLEWSAFGGRLWLTQKTAHDAAKSLEAMSKTMGKWSESIHGGLAVFSRDGDAKDVRRREERRALREETSPDGGEQP